MTLDTVMVVARNALVVTVLVAGPLLLLSLVVGLAVSIFQAVTQINEMTLTFIPKAIALFATLVLFGPWMLSLLMSYTSNLLVQLPTFAR
ncbi:MAG: flagellar biosynthesis protein FliQ [Chloroflexi bacterium]|nr:flagellar biosynthesis protein FliQ [Chloroflexota bacterium]